MHILIADDHTLFRDALVHYIQRAEPNSEVSVAKDTYEVEELLSKEGGVDLIMLDYKMPGMKGLQGLGRLLEKFPGIPVALMSGLAEEAVVEQALRMGASGYLPKTLSGKALLSAIKSIAGGEVYVPTVKNGNPLPSYYADDEEEGLENFKLTNRESEVLQFIMQGASNKEIARELGLQEVTVKLHVRGVCRKLGAKNRTQAAMIAQKNAVGSV